MGELVIAAGLWTYTYNDNIDIGKQTTVAGPSSTTTIHYDFVLQDWVVRWRTVADASTTVERQDFDYVGVPFDNSGDSLSGSIAVQSHRAVTRVAAVPGPVVSPLGRVCPGSEKGES